MSDKLSMDDAFIQKLKSILDSNLSNENFGVSELAGEAGISRSQLHRRLNDLIGTSSSQFIREYRLQKAMEMLKLNSGTASEIAYRVGFSSPTYFSTAFKNFYGYSPGEVKFQITDIPQKKTLLKRLAGIIPVVILIGLVIFNEAFNKETFDASKTEKTIVVLPFINDSDNEENLYFCNGIMAGIRDHLAKIPEYSVVSRRSAEHYRNTTSTLKAIGTELDVNYVIEGHVQRKGDRAIISAELIQVHDNKVLWSESYNKDVSETFVVQANVIKSITNKLETILSPSLSTELNRAPTQDRTAYDHYLKGEEYRFKANYSTQKTADWQELLGKAKLSYELAIEKDSMFAQAYAGLAQTIFERKGRYVLEENSLEDVIVLTNKALQINPSLSRAYITKGLYYFETKNIEKAISELEYALRLEPNNNAILNNLWSLYTNKQDFTYALKTFEKLKKRIESRKDSIGLYGKYRFYYAFMNDYKTEQFYLDKIAELKSGFSNTQVWLYTRTQEPNKAIDHIKKHWKEENQQTNAWLGAYYAVVDNEEALTYYNAWHEDVEEEGINCWLSGRSYHRYGYVLMRDGQIEKGRVMIKKQIEIFDQMIHSNRESDHWVYFDFAGVYALLGQDNKAYEMMDKFDELNGWAMWGGMVEVATIEYQFDSLRDKPRFQKWIRNGEEQLELIQNQIRPYLAGSSPYILD